MTRLTEQEYIEVLQRTRRKPELQAPPRQAQLSEKDFQQQVKDLARMLNWKTYHTLRSEGSDPGFPDFIMLRQGRMIVAELKRENEHLTQKQSEWLYAFTLLELKLVAFIEVHVWRPSDWDTIQKVLR